MTYCFTMAAAAMIKTMTFTTVMSKRHIEDATGHWVYVAYKSLDGAYTIRPFHQEGPNTDRLLTSDELVDIVRDIVRIDLDPLRNTNVARTLDKHGGAIIAKPLLEN
jgi:hypothetical protein